jgi:hypothetical protein
MGKKRFLFVSRKELRVGASEIALKNKSISKLILTERDKKTPILWWYKIQLFQY